MRKRTKVAEATTRVIVDCRDGSKDRIVPVSVAKRLFDGGILVLDLTNKKYAVPVNARLPLVLVNYAKVG